MVEIDTEKEDYEKCFLEAVKNAPKYSTILFDEVEHKIIVNPSKFDMLRAFRYSKDLFAKRNKEDIIKSDYHQIKSQHNKDRTKRAFERMKKKEAGK